VLKLAIIFINHIYHKGKKSSLAFIISIEKTLSWTKAPLKSEINQKRLITDLPDIKSVKPQTAKISILLQTKTYDIVQTFF